MNFSRAIFNFSFSKSTKKQQKNSIKVNEKICLFEINFLILCKNKSFGKN